MAKVKTCNVCGLPTEDHGDQHERLDQGPRQIIVRFRSTHKLYAGLPAVVVHAPEGGDSLTVRIACPESSHDGTLVSAKGAEVYLGRGNKPANIKHGTTDLLGG